MTAASVYFSPSTEPTDYRDGVARCKMGDDALADVSGCGLRSIATVSSAGRVGNSRILRKHSRPQGRLLSERLNHLPAAGQDLDEALSAAASKRSGRPQA